MNNNGSQNPTGGNNQPSPSRRGDSGRILNYIGIAGGIITIIGMIATVIKGVYVPIAEHTGDINEIKSSMVELDGDIKILTDDIKDLSEFVYTNTGNKGEYSQNDAASKIKKVKFVEKNFPGIDLGNNEPELQNTKWEKFVSVATDEEGKEYNSEDLQNVTFITSYMEGEKEVYFLGQYNEKNRWTGKCILNVYDGEKLDSVLEAIYNDGELFSYKRVSRESDGTWKVTDKTIDKIQNRTKDCKIGETWIYNVSETYKKNISFDDFDESRILTYEDFAYLEDEELISYYNGKTSDGYYNEDEQESYLIKYFIKGEIDFGENERVIKTLYKGNFVKGKFKDESDKSWYITREPETAYMYYEGSFSKETADRKNEKEFENPASYEYIKQKLTEKGFIKYLDEFLIDY